MVLPSTKSAPETVSDDRRAIVRRSYRVRMCRYALADTADQM